MKHAERIAKGEKLWAKASGLADAGQITEAVKVYRAGAKLGSSSAQNNLACLLDDAIKPPRISEARYWYKRALQSGNELGAWNLAMHHRNRGNLRWALHWLHIAKAMGEPEAAAEIRKLERKRARK